MWTSRGLAHSPSILGTANSQALTRTTPKFRACRLTSPMIRMSAPSHFFSPISPHSRSTTTSTSSSSVLLFPHRGIAFPNGNACYTPSTGSRSLSCVTPRASSPACMSLTSMKNGLISSWSPLSSCLHPRYFADLSAKSTEALRNIKSALHTPVKRPQLTKKEKRNLQGHLRRYMLMGGRPEFHNIDRNQHGRIFEPTDTFEVVISSSKNNCWVVVNNKGRGWRTAFVSHAGNIGQRKADRKLPSCTYRIAQNIARKLKRMGVSCCEVRCRYLLKVEICLQAFQAHGLQVTKISHVPRLPKGKPTKARKRRRV